MQTRTGDASLHETFECDLELRLLVGTSSAALQSDMDVRLSCCLGPVPGPMVTTLLSAWLIWTCVSSMAAVMLPQSAMRRLTAAKSSPYFRRPAGEQPRCSRHVARVSAQVVHVEKARYCT